MQLNNILFKRIGDEDLKTGLEKGTELKRISRDNTFSTEDVKRILKTDTNEIKKLCKQGQISLKRDVNTDATFFLKDDVEMLKRIKALHEKGKEIASRKGLQSAQGASGKSTALTSPIKRLSQSFKEEAGANAATASSANLQKEIKSLVQNLISSQDNVVKRLTKVIDEKLDGMDEIVVELIRCKTENEKLRQKIDELTKENYKMKARASAYRPVAFGLYVKERDERLF